ncbi:MAG: FG-GAP repeat protein [Anaerolineales bacterium]
MHKHVWVAFVILLIGWASTGCQPQEPEVNNPPISALIAKSSRPLPAAWEVASATRLAHEPGMGNHGGFGQAIALGDGILAVGADDSLSYPSGEQYGVVFTFLRQGDQWVQQPELTPSDRDDGTQYDPHFGNSLAMEGDLLFVGAPEADDPQKGDNTGGVYIFQRESGSWKENVTRLIPNDPLPDSGFGSRLAASGDTLAVTEGYRGRRVYLFQRQGDQWHQQAIIEGPSLQSEESYLTALDIFDDTLALSMQGHSGERENTQLSGKLLIYQRQGSDWELVQEFSSVQDNAREVELLTGTLTLDGQQGHATRLAVGGISLNDFGSGGGVWIFERNDSGWQPGEFITAADGDFMNGFGGGGRRGAFWRPTLGWRVRRQRRLFLGRQSLRLTILPGALGGSVGSQTYGRRRHGRLLRFTGVNLRGHFPGRGSGRVWQRGLRV